MLESSGESRNQTTSDRPLALIVWVAGLLATIYVVGNALSFAFLAIAFGSMDGHPATTRHLVVNVCRALVPACCYAAMGGAGLLVWRSKRFRWLGVAAVLIEVALAIAIFVFPGEALVLLDFAN